MAYKVRIAGVEGKYAITEDGKRLRIIGDYVPIGTSYTDGAAVYGYSIKNQPFLPLVKSLANPKRHIIYGFDALMQVLDNTNLAFIAEIMPLYSPTGYNGYMNGGYPYKYDDYDSTFGKNITLPNNYTYIMSSNHLFKIEAQGNLHTERYIFTEVLRNGGASATINLPASWEFGPKDYYYDVGRNGQIGIVVLEQHPYRSEFVLGYISGNNSTVFNYAYFQLATYNTGDFHQATAYTDISVEYPKDINIDDNGNGTCTIIAKCNSFQKKYKLNFDASSISLSNYDYAVCGDGYGDFDDSTGQGTITYGNLSFNAESGNKLTVTNDFIFLHGYKELGSYEGLIANYFKCKQYDLQGNLLLDYQYQYWDYFNNTRLDLYYTDDLLHRWGLGEMINIDEYYDARMKVVKQFDVRMRVNQP